MSSRFAGVWPAMLTPFTPEGRPNAEAIAQMVELFVSQGLGGIYLTGSTGQWPLLTPDERRLIAETTVSAAAGRLPVMVHVGAGATETAVELAQHAAEIGAAGVSAVGPTYYAHTAEAVFAHYAAISSATSLPFFVYHYSGVSAAVSNPAAYVERLLSLPNIAGIKYTDRDLYVLGVIHRHAAGRLTLLSGADELVCHAVLSGASGAIGTFYNLWGAEVKAAREACERGDAAAASRFMLPFQEAIDRCLGTGRMWKFLRAAMLRKYGIDVGPVRPPLGISEPDWDIAEVDELLAMVADH